MLGIIPFFLALYLLGTYATSYDTLTGDPLPPPLLREEYFARRDAELEKAWVWYNRTLALAQRAKRERKQAAEAAR